MALLKKKEAAAAPAATPEKPVNDAPAAPAPAPAPALRPKFSPPRGPKAKLGVAGISLLIGAICLFVAVFFQLVSLKTLFFF